VSVGLGQKCVKGHIEPKTGNRLDRLLCLHSRLLFDDEGASGATAQMLHIALERRAEHKRANRIKTTASGKSISSLSADLKVSVLPCRPNIYSCLRVMMLKTTCKVPVKIR
jgi:hypothetical protein